MKKILINETIFDKTLPYQDWFIEENMTDDIKVVEIDDKYYADCIKEDFNDDLTFNVEKYNARKQKEKDLARIAEIKPRLEQLSQDLIQAQVGAVFEDLEERKAEFITLHNELRQLLGMPAREYRNSNLSEN